MRALLIGLSLAATALATPGLASECKHYIVPDDSFDQRLEASVDDASFDILVPVRQPEPVLQHAVIRYYIMPAPFMLRPTHFTSINSEHPGLDPRAIPASHYRIKAFRDHMHERFGEIENLYWT